MIVPTSIALGSVLLGWALGIVGRRESASQRTASALATFALVAALAVVLAQLLPDALAEAGLPALFVFGAAAVLPSAIGKLAARFGERRTEGLSLELGYIGLLLHQAADGVGLGTYGGGPHADHHHFDVMLAIAAHTVPVIAVLTLSYARRLGLRSATLRAAGLAGASLVGIFATTLIPAGFHEVEPWVTAAVAGLLLHVVAHDFRPAARAKGTADRVIDLLAVGAGLALVTLSSGHEHGGASVRHEAAVALLDLALDTAPALLLGLAVGAVLATFGKRLPARWLRPSTPMRDAVRGALVGAPLPICACGVLPLAAALKKRGAGAAMVVAFLISTPELGVETFALTARFMGLPFALVRLAAAVGLAVLAALVVSRLTARETSTAEAATDLAPLAVGTDGAGASTARQIVDSFDELLYHVAPWTVVGLIAAAYVQAVVPTDALGELRPYGLDILVVALIAVPSYVCAASATPLAAVLLLKGMSPGAVLIGLLLGPATNLATVGFLRKTYGPRATWVGLGAVVMAAAVMALVLNHVPIPLDIAPLDTRAAETPSTFAIVTGVLLALALVRSVWQSGLRGWLASLGESLSLSSSVEPESCADGCGHDHAHHDHAHHGHAHHGHAHHDHAHHDHEHAPATELLAHDPPHHDHAH